MGISVHLSNKRRPEALPNRTQTFFTIILLDNILNIYAERLIKFIEDPTNGCFWGGEELKFVRTGYRSTEIRTARIWMVPGPVAGVPSLIRGATMV